MTASPGLDSAGRRRSPTTMPGYRAGRPPARGMLYPADPPTVEEIAGGTRASRLVGGVVGWDAMARTPQDGQKPTTRRT